MHRAGTFGAFLLSLAALAGCSAAVPGGTPETPRPDAGSPPDPCLITPADSSHRDTVVVALPAAATARFVAAHESPRPGGVDCEGAARTDSLPGYRVSSADPLILTPAAATRPVLLVRPVAPGSDPRDFVDRGADVVLTDDPATLEYARRRADLRLVPLAWSTTYVLATPDAALASALPGSLRADLAREVVRSEARPAPDGGWWESAQCRPVSSAPTGVRTVVAVPRGDGTARAIGERLVALLGRDLPGMRLLERGSDDFGSSLANAGADAFVVPLPRFAPAPATPGCADVHRIPFGLTVVPLVETRSTAVLRSGVPSFRILGDGSVRFLPGRAP